MIGKKRGPARAPDLLHIRIVRSVAALWDRPRNILARVFDIASFAMHAVLEVDLELRLVTGPDKFINARRAVPR